ncbi:MAG TPA: polymer-forming cytoskeletal protein [Polyangiaceae bacterium]|nr:polymer-forming cytoskeletal protein [Polyangiaceae bacterium]
MSANSKQTVVEEGTEFKGTLVSSCPIVVRGRIEGNVDTPALSVSEKGAVHGRAKVGSLRSLGELSGEFDAETVELSGKVKDSTVIRAKTLEVKLASEDEKMQLTFGNCELAVGDAPQDDASDARRSRAPKASKAPPLDITASSTSSASPTPPPNLGSNPGAGDVSLP